MSETDPPKPSGLSKRRMPAIKQQLLASLPPLIGVIVGALASHVAEIQRIDFERDDRFRHEQIERVGAVAHAFRGLSAPITFMLAALETNREAMCKYDAAATAMETTLIASGALHEKMFQKGAGAENAARYKAELDAAAAKPGADQRWAGALLGMMSLYTNELTSIAEGQKDFSAQATSLETSTMFDVLVYFPRRVLHRVQNDTSGYHALMHDIVAAAATPRSICDAKPAVLEARQQDLDYKSSLFLTGFAQSLEPELDDDRFKK